MSRRNLEAAVDETSVLLSVYLDPLLDDRKVLCIGSIPAAAIARMARVTRSLRVLSTSREESRGGRDVQISPFRPGPLGFAPDTFDVLLVPDLSILDENVFDRLDDLARVAGDGSVLVVSDSGIQDDRDYESFFDALADRFRFVRMLGVAPFAGATVAELGETLGSDVVVDGSLVEAARKPSRYVAVCAQLAIRLDPIVVVETASLVGRDTAPAGRVDELDALIADQREELVLERDQAARLRAALEDERGELERAETDARRANRELAEARARLVELERDHKRLRKALDEAGDASEHHDLETRLSAQAEELRDFASEVERRGTMVRELVEENLELRTHTAPRDDSRAVERALRAEAERAEAVFLTDELRSRIAELGSDTEEVRQSREADLAGRVRGLTARLAELEETRALAEGRLALAESDLGAARERERRLAAAYERIREDLELEIVRSRGPASSTDASIATLRESERELAEAVGALSAQLLLAREKELESRGQRDLARGEGLALVAQVSALETQLSEHKQRVLDSLSAAVNATRSSGSDAGPDSTVEGNVRILVATCDALRGERDGLRLRLEANERSSTRESATTSNDVLDELDRLRADVATLRDEGSTLRVELADAETDGRRDAQRAADLTAAVAARDALVTRLQMDLAEAEQHGKVLRDRAQHLASEGERLREAVLHGASAAEDKDELVRRVNVLEAELSAAVRARDTTTENLGRVRDELLVRVAELAATVDAEKAAAAAAIARQELDARALAETRAILEGLRSRPEAGSGLSSKPGFEAGEEGASAPRAAEPDGRDTVIRSLTSQLEERDDRVRALERRLSGQGSVTGADEAVRRELLELKERSVRLGEELGVEREARRLAEERSAQLASLAAVESELRDLEKRLALRDRDVDSERERVEDLSRDVRMLRDAFADARTGLEALFGTASASGDPELADRLGALLTSLARY